ncbi:MAG TPA: uroporphyrinogen decarboxylase family protein [bacterium]|nr:uroporphyrinogen decarboxylase family protein [bacterium]HPN45507.1 uroporphyrinogen decarboxylase family protein [bacterium]
MSPDLSSPLTDILDALHCRQPQGAVPLWELEFHLWDRFSDQRVILGTEFTKLTRKEQERALHTNAEIMYWVSSEYKFAALTIPGGYWEIAPGAPAWFWLPPQKRIQQAKLLYNIAHNDVLLMAITGGVLAMPGADNYLSFSIQMLEEPEKIASQAQDCYSQGLENAKRLRDAGVEGFITASDLADNRGPYFNPQQMQEFILPWLRRWAGEIKKLQAFPILHSDGNIMPCLAELLSSGIMALQALDPVAGIELANVKKQALNKVCLCGNVDCGLFLQGAPEQVFEETSRLLQLNKPGGGFVLGASNVIQPQTHKENFMAMIEAWREYGQYGNDNKS